MTATTWGDTIVRVVKGDITECDVDVIVNAANSSLLGGGGVDGAIHRAAGPELLAECRAVVARQGSCDTGDAVITGGGNLLASHVVHTVGPVWTGDQPDRHDQLLARCYTASLGLADEAGASSIAFPSISTGVYRFPKERAAAVATTAARNWLTAAPRQLDEVTFVCFSDEDFEIYADIISPTSV
jgi:O-acetyl-ADP-ribose deacetylase (regulator of RNase III)